MGVYARGGKLWISYKAASGKWRDKSTGLDVGEEALAREVYAKIVEEMNTRRGSQPVETNTKTRSRQLPKHKVFGLVRITDDFLSTFDAWPKPETRQVRLFDSETTGFGVTISRTGRNTFIARAKIDKVSRSISIGVAGAKRADGSRWDADSARIEAIRIVELMKGGLVDPAKNKAGRAEIEAVIAAAESATTVQLKPGDYRSISARARGAGMTIEEYVLFCCGAVHIAEEDVEAQYRRDLFIGRQTDGVETGAMF